MESLQRQMLDLTAVDKSREIYQWAFDMTQPSQNEKKNNCICVLDAIMKVMHSQYVGISVRFPPIPFSNNQLALCQSTKKGNKKKKKTTTR